MALRFAEVQSFVSDLKRARLFYEDLLGLRAGEAGADFLFFDLGGVAFLLLAGARPRLERAPYGGEAETVLCLASEDLEEDVRRLRAAGASFEGEIAVVPQGRWIALRDPDGNRVELVQAAPGGTKYSESNMTET